MPIKKDIEDILIVGSGVMGTSIAQVFAGAGIRVGLMDVEKSALDRAMALIESGLITMADFNKIDRHHIPAILNRINPSTDMAKIAENAGMAIEAVPENVEIKREVFSQLDKVCGKDTILASNTSGLDIFNITDIKRPERLIITHFFAPAHIIPLVEVVPGPETSSDVVAQTVKLLETAGKRAVVLKTFIPSFIVNRIQNAIGTVVQEMLENNWASPEDIDRAVKLSLGIRLPIVGVVQTADFNGLDLICDIFKGLGIDSAFFNGLVEQGRLGVKTSKGIYDYGGRSEAEILKKRDKLFLDMIDYLDRINAFDPV